MCGVAAALLAGLPSACLPTRTYVRQGDANSVEISYTGDLVAATRVARDHCASYERVAKLVDRGEDTALFDCVKP